jgi:hypothetical protein
MPVKIEDKLVWVSYIPPLSAPAFSLQEGERVWSYEEGSSRKKFSSKLSWKWVLKKRPTYDGAAMGSEFHPESFSGTPGRLKSRLTKRFAGHDKALDLVRGMSSGAMNMLWLDIQTADHFKKALTTCPVNRLVLILREVNVSLFGLRDDMEFYEDDTAPPSWMRIPGASETKVRPHRPTTWDRLNDEEDFL